MLKIKNDKKYLVEKILDYWLIKNFNIVNKKVIELEDDLKLSKIFESLVDFIKFFLSGVYLFFLKRIGVTEENKKTLNVIWENLLILFHPLAPFITEWAFKENFDRYILNNEKINSSESLFNLTNEFIIYDEYSYIVDLSHSIFLTIKSKIDKNNSEKSYINGKKDIFLELEDNFLLENSKHLEIIHSFLETVLCEYNINFLNKKDLDKENEKFISVTVYDWIDKHKILGVVYLKIKKNYLSLDIKNLEKKLSFFESEYIRAKKILENKNFLDKAPEILILEEKKKLSFYFNKMNKIKKELDLFLNKEK